LRRLRPKGPRNPNINARLPRAAHTFSVLALGWYETRCVVGHIDWVATNREFVSDHRLIPVVPVVIFCCGAFTRHDLMESSPPQPEGWG
ncbi:MAG: hypothetical protein ACOX9E_13190, partial [Lentisphaeria bacterium]